MTARCCLCVFHHRRACSLLFYTSIGTAHIDIDAVKAHLTCNACRFKHIFRMRAEKLRHDGTFNAVYKRSRCQFFKRSDVGLAFAVFFAKLWRSREAIGRYEFRPHDVWHAVFRYERAKSCIGHICHRSKHEKRLLEFCPK